VKEMEVRYKSGMEVGKKGRRKVIDREGRKEGEKGRKEVRDRKRWDRRRNRDSRDRGDKVKETKRKTNTDT
jgi:hypothetical protein